MNIKQQLFTGTHRPTN